MADTQFHSDHDLLIDMRGRLLRMEDDIREVKDSMNGNFVSNDRFKNLEDRHDRLEKIVYAIISIPLLGFLSALVYLVWKQ